MTNLETRLGLTNIFKRLAYSFLCRGLGAYAIKHTFYTKVVVEEFYAWQPNPVNNDEYGSGIRVVFYRDDKRVRWVEFGIRATGGGGDSAIFEV